MWSGILVSAHSWVATTKDHYHYENQHVLYQLSHTELNLPQHTYLEVASTLNTLNASYTASPCRVCVTALVQGLLREAGKLF